MSDIAENIRRLVICGDYEISEHAAGRLVRAGVLIERFALMIGNAIVVEEYPEYHKGSCVLFLDFDEFGRPLYLLWGTPLNAKRPAFLVTAYRPDPERWSTDFRGRRST